MAMQRLCINQTNFIKGQSEEIHDMYFQDLGVFKNQNSKK